MMNESDERSREKSGDARSHHFPSCYGPSLRGTGPGRSLATLIHDRNVVKGSE